MTPLGERSPLSRLFEAHNNWTGDCVSHSKSAAEVLKRVAKGVEGGDHLRPRLRQSLDIDPFCDDAIAVVARLDDVGIL